MSAARLRARAPAAASAAYASASSAARGERREHERDRIAVEGSAGRRQERPEPRRRGREPRVVREAPGQDAGRVVEREVPRHQQQQAGDDRTVQAEAVSGPQLRVPLGGVTGRRAPQEHTTLRTAHSILRKRPHAGHPR
jgi:hypothetical protein